MRRRSRSPDETRAAARALAREAPKRGGTVALVGPLGAGKTAFVKGLAEGLGLDPAVVSSPTFVIAAEYEAPGGPRLAHLDLYRVASEAELEAAGFLDLLGPGTLLVVEWADRLPDALPADRLTVRIDRPDAAHRPEERVLHAEASGAASAAWLGAWEEALAAAPDAPEDR